MSILDDDQILRIGEALRPLLAELPEIPLHVWHRFSFDVVQNTSGVNIAHVRFAPITAERTSGNEWRPWGSPQWPDWQDIGKVAEFKMPGGEIVRGRLEYEDMTPGPDEAPLIFIRRADGTRASLADAEFWRYTGEHRDERTEPNRNSKHE